MSDGHDELDMAHAFTTHFFLGDFYAASVADDAFVADAFVFSAVTFVVLYRAEYAFAEESVAFGLVGAVVDCFGF